MSEAQEGRRTVSELPQKRFILAVMIAGGAALAAAGLAADRREV